MEIKHARCPWCGNLTPLDIESRVTDGKVFTCETCSMDIVVVKCPLTGVVFMDKFDDDDLLMEGV